MPDSQTITIKQSMRFQRGTCIEKNQLNQIQNRRLAAIIDFIMRNILNVRCHEGICPEKYQHAKGAIVMI